jgi:hypothetical protein
LLKDGFVVLSGDRHANVEVTGAARLYRAASVRTAGLWLSYQQFHHWKVSAWLNVKANL